MTVVWSRYQCLHQEHIRRAHECATECTEKSVPQVVVIHMVQELLFGHNVPTHITRNSTRTAVSTAFPGPSFRTLLLTWSGIRCP